MKVSLRSILFIFIIYSTNLACINCFNMSDLGLKNLNLSSIHLDNLNISRFMPDLSRFNISKIRDFDINKLKNLTFNDFTTSLVSISDNFYNVKGRKVRLSAEDMPLEVYGLIDEIIEVEFSGFDWSNSIATKLNVPSILTLDIKNYTIKFKISTDNQKFFIIRVESDDSENVLTVIKEEKAKLMIYPDGDITFQTEHNSEKIVNAGEFPVITASGHRNATKMVFDPSELRSAFIDLEFNSKVGKYDPTIYGINKDNLLALTAVLFMVILLVLLIWYAKSCS